MKFEITKEELDAIKYYKNENGLNIDRLMSNDIEMDLSFLSQEKNIDYSNDAVIQNIDIIKKIYSAILKSFYNNPQEIPSLYKVTNIAEIENLKNTDLIKQFIDASSDKDEAIKQATNLVRPVVVQLDIDKNIPFMDLKNISDEYNGIVLMPFTELENIEEISNDVFKEYKIGLKFSDLKELSEDDKNSLYEHIIEISKEINYKLQECLNLDEENTIHYENIRKLEQLLANHHYTMEQPDYETDTTDEEKQSDLDDIDRINNELDVLKGVSADVFYKRQENIKFITDWKNDISVYLSSELFDIKQKLSNSQNDDSAVEKATDEEDKEEGSDLVIDEEKLEEDNTETITENVETIDENETLKMKEVKNECKENIAVIDTLLNNIKQLISKQQNHARIAEELDSNYKALNNAFEMRNYAEELQALVNSIYTKIKNTTDEEELDKISKTNIQISVLLNYLNNAKSSTTKGVKRFDELEIIEENELKREIAETIKNIRCEAELRKLNDDIEIIEEKSSWKKFIGRFTGSNKVDETILEQINVRQNAIRKTFRNKLPLAHNYSIHQLIAEIEMFIKDNKDDELVVEDVNNLRKIKNTLKKNFVIIDSKVQTIIEQKTGKNLPLASKKLSKSEIIEIDTYRFLNKYGYDIPIDNHEPDYQDTIANEIKRIVDYIKSSGIL